MQDKQLFCLQGQAGKGTAVVVRELDLEDVRSQFLDNGSDLPALQLAFRQGLGQCHDIKKFDSRTH